MGVSAVPGYGQSETSTQRVYGVFTILLVEILGFSKVHKTACTTNIASHISLQMSHIALGDIFP